MDLRRACSSFSFLLAVAGVWIIFYAGAKSELNAAMDVLVLFKYSIEASGVNTLYLLFCVLPYTTSFCTEWSSHYLKSVVIRIGPVKYALSKLVACALSSALAVMLGISIFILSFLARLPLVSTTAPNYKVFTRTLGGEFLQNGPHIAYFALYILLLSLAGAFWATVGLCASAYLPNKFVALFTPYIGMFALSLLTSGLPPYLQINRITRTGVNMGGTFASLLYSVFFIGILFAGIGFLFVTKIKKRVSE